MVTKGFETEAVLSAEGWKYPRVGWLLRRM